jgi:hypothetical protein
MRRSDCTASLQLISHNFSANVANFVPNFVVKFKSSYHYETKPLIGLFLLRDQSEALFTYGLVNFSMNFWTSQRSSERSSQHSRKSYMKSTVTKYKCILCIIKLNIYWLFSSVGKVNPGHINEQVSRFFSQSHNFLDSNSLFLLLKGNGEGNGNLVPRASRELKAAT